MANPIVLPTSAPSPNIDHNQKKILEQLQKYLDFKQSEMSIFEQESRKTLFSSSKGLCAGLAAYWLYCKRTGMEGMFIHQLEYLLTWDPNNVVDVKVKEDRIIEELMNVIEFLQFDAHPELRGDKQKNPNESFASPMLRSANVNPELSGVKQYNIHESFKLLLPKYADQVADPEFTITFVFNQEKLTKLITDVVKTNKMIRLSNMEHAIGLIYSGNKYYLYNASSSLGPQEFANVEEVSAAIFSALGAYSFAKDTLALNLMAFDIIEETPTPLPPIKYPDATEYKQQLLADPNYAKLVKTNPEIFELASRHNDFEVLIQGDVYKNYRNHLNQSALEVAIERHAPEIMYELLAAGANPYEPISDGSSLWELAILRRNTAAVILLLAFGTEITKKDFRTIYARFTRPEVQTLINHAIRLNRKLLHVPDVLNLDTATGHDIVVFLRDAKLKNKLGRSLDIIRLQSNNQQLTGLDALDAIAKYYKTPSNGDIFDFAQKAEIYKLLKFFKPAHFSFKGSRELLTLLDKIAKQITSKKIQEHSKKDIIEIGVILAELQELASQPSRMHPRKLYLSHKAAVIKKSIEKYLLKNGIPSITEHIARLQYDSHQRNYLFFTPDPDTADIEPEISFRNDVAPLLRI